MTLKTWNNLAQYRRTIIADIFYHNMSEEFRSDISRPFFHRLSWNGGAGTYQEGRWYELMLKHCTVQKDGYIKLTIEESEEQKTETFIV